MNQRFLTWYIYIWHIYSRLLRCVRWLYITDLPPSCHSQWYMVHVDDNLLIAMKAGLKFASRKTSCLWVMEIIISTVVKWDFEKLVWTLLADHPGSIKYYNYRSLKCTDMSQVCLCKCKHKCSFSTQLHVMQWQTMAPNAVFIIHFICMVAVFLCCQQFVHIYLN